MSKKVEIFDYRCPCRVKVDNQNVCIMHCSTIKASSRARSRSRARVGRYLVIQNSAHSVCLHTSYESSSQRTLFCRRFALWSRLWLFILPDNNPFSIWSCTFGRWQHRILHEFTRWQNWISQGITSRTRWQTSSMWFGLLRNSYTNRSQTKSNLNSRIWIINRARRYLRILESTKKGIHEELKSACQCYCINFKKPLRCSKERELRSKSDIVEPRFLHWLWNHLNIPWNRIHSHVNSIRKKQK